MEFVVAIYESNSVKAITDQKLPKKDFYEAMSWFFNVRVGHWHGTLNAAKARKIDKGSPYLSELVQTFTDYAERGIWKNLIQLEFNYNKEVFLSR